MKRQISEEEKKWGHQGPFWREHNFPPAPFNPDSECTKAGERYNQVSASMQADNFYQTHTQPECKEEWARRYKLLWETEHHAEPNIEWKDYPQR